MEFCRGGDLALLIKNYRRKRAWINEDFIWKMIAQITSALKHCHRYTTDQGSLRPVLHRDLKPANVLLDHNMDAKLCDFGLADILTSGSNSRVKTPSSISTEVEATGMSMGTPFYMSPERVNNCKYDERSDIWSVGCIVYELASLSPPFEACNHVDLAAKINSGKVAELPLHYTEELQRTCAWMLRHDVSRRPRVEDIESLPQLQLLLREIRCSMREDTYREKKQKFIVEAIQKEEELKSREEQLLAREDKAANLQERLRAYAKKLLKWERGLMAAESKSSLVVSSDDSEGSSDESENIGGKATDTKGGAGEMDSLCLLSNGEKLGIEINCVDAIGNADKNDLATRTTIRVEKHPNTKSHDRRCNHISREVSCETINSDCVKPKRPRESESLVVSLSADEEEPCPPSTKRTRT
eukprot:CAMPEP_0116035682 /NCGR_PEP_ID=MMETSP0321-20121206/20555_1 /TAXON_ID=163516 /ORGANISM="Leptocylindrus danicus var. danicus, Strain B650" /LENGTH=412 /DNA_ID=CAMNT_0003512645 /DNA_START=325 /DNA_END=1563 /DNA_ORIENTATION=+